MTELGEVVNNMMKEAFPSIVDVNFTANMEALLDGVEDGSIFWKTIVRNFYPDLAQAVAEAEKELEEYKIEDEVTDVILRGVRTQHGDQVRSSRKISGMSGISGMPQYEAVSGKDRRKMSGLR